MDDGDDSLILARSQPAGASGLEHDFSDSSDSARKFQSESLRAGCKTLQVVFEPEDAPPVDADSLEYAVSVEQAVVQHGDARLASLDHSSFDPDLHRSTPAGIEQIPALHSESKGVTADGTNQVPALQSKSGGFTTPRIARQPERQIPPCDGPFRHSRATASAG